MRFSYRYFWTPKDLLTNEFFPMVNGSTGLPFDISLRFIQSIQWIRNAYILGPGICTIEYELFDPRTKLKVVRN